MSQPRVLLADDDPRLVHVVSMFLSMEGYDVDTALDGDEALEALQTTHYDAAILDVMMPGIDGIEICRRVREQPATRTLPILIYTGLSGQADSERARLAGATNMITKPFSLPGLGAVLRACMAHTTAALAS